MNETPYRERARVLFCPRCGDSLERVSTGVEMCSRCEGAWLASATIEKAFGDEEWPKRPGAWWRRALDCPACAFDGAAQALAPVIVGPLIVDRCLTHGIWLDHGELGRLLGAPKVVELEALYERIKPGGELPPALLEQRKRRQRELARRQKEIDDYRAKLAAEQARIAAEQKAAQRKKDDERRAVERAKREAIKTAERKRLTQLRAVEQKKVDADEQVLLEVRKQVLAAEGKLASSRARVQEIERQLEALDRPEA